MNGYKSKVLRSAEAASKPDQAVEGSRWNATAAINKAPITAVVTVSRPHKKAVTLSVAYDNGAIWVFDCILDGQTLTVKQTERRKVADVNLGKANLPPVGGTRGTGTLRQDKLTLNYIVPGENGQAILDVRLKAELQK